MRNRFLQSLLAAIAVATSLSSCATSVPIGGIVAYGGDTAQISTDYLICEGQKYLQKGEYSDLFKVIGKSWGGTIDSFYLPDLRGLFLRGVNGQRNDLLMDSEANSRLAKNLKDIAGNKVGSLQFDTLKSHSHGYYAPPNGSDRKGHDPGNISQDPIRHLQTDTYGGSETRPKNAYVYYLIRAK